jgi:hypothetical protein
MVGDTIAEFCAITGTDFDYAGIPETGIVLMGPLDMRKAVMSSLALRGTQEPTDIFSQLKRWVPGHTANTKALSLTPFTRTLANGYSELGATVRSGARGSVLRERYMLTRHVRTTSITEGFTITARPRLTLVRDVDAGMHNELIGIFYEKVRQFSGVVALGPMELLTDEDIRERHLELSYHALETGELRDSSSNVVPLFGR